MKKLQKWIDDNLLDVEWENSLSLIVGGKRFMYLEERSKILDDNFEILYKDYEIELFSQNEYDYVLFQFGERFYYSSPESSPIDLNEFRYIGECKTPIDLPFLGVHGPYELGNGSRNYNDWVTKAKFLGISSLAICEKSTLAGALLFQAACQKKGIAPIIGETVSVKDGKDVFEAKLFVHNQQGWRNLLRINKKIRVDNYEARVIDKSDFLAFSKGLTCILIPSTELSDKRILSLKRASFEKVLFQFDPTMYRSEAQDEKHLQNLKRYLIHFSKLIEPIIISDAYYLDKGDGHIKRHINSIVKVSHDYASYDQFFKSWEEVYLQIENLFNSGDVRLDSLFERSEANLLEIGNIDFAIPTKELHLPKYNMTKQESDQNDTNEDLFWSLIAEGIEKKLPEYGKPGFDTDTYFDRIQTESEIISKGGFVDYFLILWDIIKWSEQNDIMTGVGRGSAGGSLIAYLLDITKLNPITYGLLFERFLNEGRIGKSLPDIDTDFQGSRRDEVKQYMRDRYGYENVCVVGTYTTFAARGALKDLGKEKGIDFAETNYISGALEDSYTNMRDLFVQATKKPILKDFIQEHVSLFEDMPLILNQPKTESIHAAAVVITPKKSSDGEDMTIFDWMPIKKMNGLLVSEWEGPLLEEAGFLKEDILGIKQLDKLSSIRNLIRKNGGTPPSFEDIQKPGRIDDQGVYKLFHKGLNQDLFHFGSVGLTGYSQDVKPNNIEDLIAMIALYRPGAMESDAHKIFVEIRNGNKSPEYDFMLKEVTKDTAGQYIYQEQVMKAVQILGGFNLTEADGIRKAMGKKIVEKMDSYKVQFLKHAIEEKSCPSDQAEAIWEKLERFAGYGFNKSHAAAYSITGYACQYFKYHYPVEFWTTSLDQAEDDELILRINEIGKLNSHIKLLTPDINESTSTFVPNFEESTIFWSLGKIPYIGPAGLDAIMEEREKGGDFFSISDFKDRVPAKKVKRPGVINLILSGAFDRLYSIKSPKERLILLQEYHDMINTDLPEEYQSDNTKEDVFWVLKQRSLVGLGFFDYEEMLRKISPYMADHYLDPQIFQYKESVKDDVVMAGILDRIIEKKTKNGDPYAQIILDNNNQIFEMTLWSTEWWAAKKILKKNKGNLIAINGQIKFDKKYLHKNVLWATSKTKVVELLSTKE